MIVLCFIVRNFVSNTSFATILMGKRELVALLCLSSWCLMIVVWLFLVVPQVCLQFVILVFPDHTHYFCYGIMTKSYYYYVNMCIMSHGPKMSLDAAKPVFSFPTN